MIATQWQGLIDMKGLRVVGLNYQNVKAGLEMAGIALTPEQFADLRLIELGAMRAINGVS